jgi:tetratricopeptide (TPR) repeat protein
MKRLFLMLVLITLILGLNAQAKRIVLFDLEKSDNGASSIYGAMVKTDLPGMFAQSGQYTLVDAKEVSKALKKTAFKAPSEMSKDDLVSFAGQYQADLVMRGTLSSVSNTQFKLVMVVVSTKTNTMKRFTVELPISASDRATALNTNLLPQINDMAGGELDREFGVCERDFAGKNFDAAETGLVKYLAMDPNRARAYYLLGKIRAQKQDNTQAITDFNNGLKVAPNDTDLLSELADAYKADGQPDNAVAALQKLAALNPTDAAPWLRIASIYNDAGDKDKTLEALRGAVAKSPDNNRIRLVFANQLYESQLYDEALPQYERCAEAFPENETIDKRLGVCYERTGKFNEAIARYSSSLQNNPNDAKILAKRAGVYLQAARNATSAEDAVAKADASVKDYQTLLAKDANNANLILAMSDAALTAAAACERIKDDARQKSYMDQGIQAIQNALRIAPENARVHLKLAALYYDQKKYADAQKSAETSIQKDPAIIEAYILMSRIYQNYGIDKYNLYVDLDRQYQNSSAVGSKIDALRDQRKFAKRDANDLFQKAAGYLDTAKGKTDDSETLKEIQRSRDTLSQYIKQTQPDFFDK